MTTLASTSIPIQPDMESHKLHETLEIVAIFLDVLGAVGCLAMLLNIWAYKSYHSTKDRLILGICIITLLFVTLGNLPEKFSRIDDMYVPRDKWNIFFEFSTWWAALLFESALLAYSLSLLWTIRSGSALKPQAFPLVFELGVVVLIIGLSCLAGALSLNGVVNECVTTASTVQYYDPSGNCYDAQATINFVWMAFLLVPTLIQATIWRTLHKAHLLDERYHEIVARGENVEDPDIALAPALLRIIKTVVKPLQWYPVVFLITSVLYVVWIIATHTREEHQKWAHVASPASNLVFSTKGISTACIFFFSQENRSRERGICEQIQFRFRDESVRVANNPYINELLLSDDSSYDSSVHGNSSRWVSVSRSSRHPSNAEQGI